MHKIALFGGTFDPVHVGHTDCMQHLLDKMDFEKVVLIPTSQNPLKVGQKPAPEQDRLKMLGLATADFQQEVTIDDFEVVKGETSYSYETLQRYQESYRPEQLYFVMGQDTFQDFDKWKNFSEIVAMTNILVVSRPGFSRPLGIEDLPSGLQAFVHTYERGFALLNTGRTIEFLNVKTEDVSSTLVRKKLRTGKSLQSLIDMNVERYIKENNVYPSLEPQNIDFLALTENTGRFLKERAMNCMGYDLTGQDRLYDYTLVASATSTKQAQSLANLVKDQIKEDFGLSPLSLEGREEGRWVILDYGSLIVHIFYDFVRQEYHLEELWREGRLLKF